MATNIHPTAIIHPGCELGQDVQIGPYVIIENKTIIGDRTRVDAFAQVKSYTQMGTDNHIYSYACIGEVPQDLKFKGEETWLKIGNNNKIREYSTLNRGTGEGGGVTTIGSNCFFMAYTHVAHDCHLEDGVILANCATLAGHVHVGQKSVIGGLSAVHQFVHIGEYAFIGGKTGVAQDVPPFMLVAGERAKVYGPNTIGLRRAGFSKEQISALKKAYHTLWRSGLTQEQALEKIQAEFGQLDVIQKFVQFVKNSQRGVVSPNP
ncbi:acyl-ACP--UDP-N-acetylglucosamine O-acyltransferase [Desulfohalobiaceae bacterium Ax17]|uniref:acyl-ACP--UDP-N-acetylglucosamine O-acyltransferase n=1 Tax=Desulfovulcanus ferrireducens TaxID=2831190 RepID=UPI00207B9B34|nr:acyl-ACP--UDP-N-acetylglucosamine O-acyltransferase [Desulfovulcanus ferrireducens]